jgi:hypothetical protein
VALGPGGYAGRYPYRASGRVPGCRLPAGRRTRTPPARRAPPPRVGYPPRTPPRVPVTRRAPRRSRAPAAGHEQVARWVRPRVPGGVRECRRTRLGPGPGVPGGAPCQPHPRHTTPGPVRRRTPRRNARPHRRRTRPRATSPAPKLSTDRPEQPGAPRQSLAADRRYPAAGRRPPPAPRRLGATCRAAGARCAGPKTPSTAPMPPPGRQCPGKGLWVPSSAARGRRHDLFEQVLAAPAPWPGPRGPCPTVRASEFAPEDLLGVLEKFLIDADDVRRAPGPVLGPSAHVIARTQGPGGREDPHANPSHWGNAVARLERDRPVRGPLA